MWPNGAALWPRVHTRIRKSPGGVQNCQVEHCSIKHDSEQASFVSFFPHFVTTIHV